ncbi:MAG: efflux RND transporter periplasmic adaptor subunit, partial [Acidocella sp.]|nr:efflux RND transporter periplasmic adaptor subunit [Acidocella sp.]
DRFKAGMIAKFVKQFANPPESVATVTASASFWHDRVDAVASLRAEQGADLSTDVDGIIDVLNFKSGDEVQAGAVLMRLRTEDDAARTAQLQSALSLAQANYQRDQRQLAAQAVARATVDADLSALHQAQAALAQQQALIAKKTLVAPFSGRLGIRQVDQGQYVAAGTSVVTLQALDPIFADFYVPQAYIARLRAGASVTLDVDAYPGQPFTGTILALNSRLDAATRTLQVRATIANKNHQLLPGMFGTVHVVVGSPHAYVTLPQTALTYNPYGATVFLAVQKTIDGKPAEVARQIFVQTGPTRGDQVAILHGVTAGNTVVVAGGNKLHNGTVLQINNAVLPLDAANPHPAEE